MTVMNVMAPLVIGDPVDPNNEASRAAWQRFDEQLATVKALGAQAVSTDVWWGLIEKTERRYDWRYYDKLRDHIKRAGLKWVPIISLHQCGGNVGDNVYVPLPGWIWTKLVKKIASGNVSALKYVSEQGNACHEVVSAWATDLVLDDYIALFKTFLEHYAADASLIVEINISLGPAGELRFPSYNSHDKGTDYPSRGALQCYSELAVKSFQDWVFGKYKDWDGVRKAWGKVVNIEPPRDCRAFFANRVHIDTQYGRDLFDWYSESLIAHGRKVLTAALEVFAAEGSAFAGIDIGAKVPGVHWFLGYWYQGKRVIYQRLAELAAGVIRTSDAADWETDEKGRGYRPIVALFKELGQLKPGTRVVLHFTCLEMPDPQKNFGINSLAHSLVMWVGNEARKQGVPLKGENALNYTITSHNAWELIRSALRLPNNDGPYEGLTVLRMTDVVNNNVTSAQFRYTCEQAAKMPQKT